MEQYERLKILGVGSYGKVYLMRHRQQRRLVCAKIIKIKNIPRKEREACRTEVDLLRKLNHPNIVGYKDSFLTPRKDHLCIVMEYCDGGDLSTQIKNARKRLFPESKILHWFVQIALGLHYMHGRLVLHRDLKTQNIFLLGNGRLVLGDLGISKVLEGTMDFASTRIGTPYYMSPELFNNKPYNHKSDIWALGCVLYEMAALSHAFDASSLHGLAQRVAKGRYPSIHVKYSRNLRDLISRMLSTSPSQRPDLDQILQLGFVKKHIHNFLADIVSRESHKIGEGTMVLKAAAVNMLADAEGSSGASDHDEGGDIAGLGSNRDMLALKRQMEELGLQDEVKRALNPPEAIRPTDARTAAKVVKKQAGALRREEDRRKAVESALARLRKEREERLRLRHATESRNPPVGPPPPLPPPPPPNPNGAGSDHAANRIGGAWQAGVVGVGVAAASGSRGGSVADEGRGRRGAGAAAARQLEAVAARRVGGLLAAGGGGGGETREGRAAVSPDVRGQATPRSCEGRRSLEPRERREILDRKLPARIQSRRQSFGGGEGRKASSPGMGGAVAAGMGGGGGRARSNAADPSPSDVARVKDLDKFSRAREAERLAAEAMARREEASSREAARKREETLQRERERDRLRRDKVELDRKMLEREQRRRQRAAAVASKAAAAKAKEAREALLYVQDQRSQERKAQPSLETATAATVAGTPPSASPAETAAVAADPATELSPSLLPPPPPAMVPPQQQQLVVATATPAAAVATAAAAAEEAEEAAAEAVSLAEAAAVRPPVLSQPPPPPRVRARWAHAGAGRDASGTGNSAAPPEVASPPTTAGVTSAVWEVIERRKRERADLEEAVHRKERVAARETEDVTKNEAWERVNNPPPPPPRPPQPPSSATDEISRTRPAASVGKDPGSNRPAGSSGNPPLVPTIAKRGDGNNSNNNNNNNNSNSNNKDNSSNNSSLSPYVSNSEEDSEDSDNPPWGVGVPGAVGKAVKANGLAVGAGVAGRRAGGRRKRQGNIVFGSCNDSGGGGDGNGGQIAGSGGRGAGPADDEDEADEDIHAREELLEVELQAATTRCEALRHNLQETKSMIPATALVVVDGGGGTDGDGSSASGVRSGGGRGQRSTTSNANAAEVLATAASGAPPRDANEAEEDDDVEEEEEEEDEDDNEGEEGVKARTPNAAAPAARGSFRTDNYYGDMRPPGTRVRRAWGPAADAAADDADGTLPAGKEDAAGEAAPAAGRRKWGIGAGGGSGSSGSGGGGGDGGRGRAEASAVQQVGGGGRGASGGGGSDSSESRNSYYPYDQSQLESEAKALHGHGGVCNDENEDDSQPKKLFQRRSSSQASRASSSSSSSASSSSVATAAAAGKNSRTGSTRENKRASRHSSSNSALPPPHAAAAPASNTSGTGTRGRAETRAADNGLVTALAPAPARPPRARTPSPPPSAPAGRLADRIRTLRERCCLGLGADAFERAYGYLKAQEQLDELGGESVVDLDVDREERLVRGLTDILGQSKIHYYSLIDQLIFIENTHIGSGL